MMVFLHTSFLVHWLKHKGAYKMDRDSLFYKDKNVLSTLGKVAFHPYPPWLSPPMKIQKNNQNADFEFLSQIREHKRRYRNSNLACDACLRKYHVVYLFFLPMPMWKEIKSWEWCPSLKTVENFHRKVLSTSEMSHAGGWISQESMSSIWRSSKKGDKGKAYNEGDKVVIARSLLMSECTDAATGSSECITLLTCHAQPITSTAIFISFVHVGSTEAPSMLTSSRVEATAERVPPDDPGTCWGLSKFKDWEAKIDLIFRGNCDFSPQV